MLAVQLALPPAQIKVRPMFLYLLQSSTSIAFQVLLFLTICLAHKLLYGEYFLFFCAALFLQRKFSDPRTWRRSGQSIVVTSACRPMSILTSRQIINLDCVTPPPRQSDIIVQPALITLDQSQRSHREIWFFFSLSFNKFGGRLHFY